MEDEDLRFLQRQAQEYLTSRAWEGLAGDSLALFLKAGSWYEARAQAMHSEAINAVFLFPGSRDMPALQKAGMAEPPAGTILAEMGQADPKFAVMDPAGWVQPSRLETRLMALAFAAIRTAASSSAQQTAGDLTLPGQVRGRFRAVRIKPDPEAGQMVMGIPSFDLYGPGGDCTATMLTVGWPEYATMRGRAEHYQGVGNRFEDAGSPISVLVLSGAPNPAEVREKLRASDPRGLTFGEMEGALTVLAGGLKETYVVMQSIDEREQILLWWHDATSRGGAHAIVVAEPTPDLDQMPWDPGRVYAVFEFGKQDG